MLTKYFTRVATIEKRRRGMVGPYLDDFIKWLESRGYHRSTIRLHIRKRSISRYGLRPRGSLFVN